MFWIFSRYDVIDLQYVNKSQGVNFQMLLLIVLIFLNIQMGFIIIKDRLRAVYFNNQKNVAFYVYIYGLPRLKFCDLLLPAVRVYY